MSYTSGANVTSLTDPRPYKCEVDVEFPTVSHARRARDVLSVDKEIGDRTVRTLTLVSTSDAARAAASCAGENMRAVDRTVETSGGSDEVRVMRIRIEATEAKMLRVSLSTFYDVINVVLRCFQEFDGPQAVS